MINKQIELQKAINNLDKDKIHLLFFDYSLKQNWLSKPFLIIFKLFFRIQGKPAIDHVCHISRFIYNNETGDWDANIFESTLHGGVQEVNLFDKLKDFKGKLFIKTLGNVDKVRAREFEKKYLNVAYSLILAGLSGLDLNFKYFDSVNNLKNTKGGFCSWLVSLFLINQDYDISTLEKGNPLEITPADLFSFNLGETKLFFK